VAVFLFICLMLLGQSMWNAQLSCLSSIGASVYRIEPISLVLRKPMTSTWRVLSNQEADKLFLSIKPYDCPRTCGIRYKDGMLVDLWGRRLKIALKGDREIQGIRVWSLGLDGQSGTWDDVVIPYGETAIPE